MHTSASSDIETIFPNLKDTDYRITSPYTPKYNCIAWAAGESHRWWEPDNMFLYYWPEDAPREYTLEAYILAYGTIGYACCDTGDLEDGYEKIVIYVDTCGAASHAARQLSSGKWTSKLGRSEDIEHVPHGLAGETYGSVAQFLKRPR